MANIQGFIDQIKTAIYGKEVRGSLADGLDAVNKETEATSKKQSDLDATFEQLIINAGDSNAEIVASRHNNVNGETYDTLPKRLDATFLDLETNTTRIEELGTNVMSFGAKGDSVTDDTLSLQNFFDSLPFGSKVVFPHKRAFKITKPLEVSAKKNIHIDFNGSSLLYAGTDNLDSNNGNDRVYGAITIRGKLLEETRTNVVDIVSNEGVIDPEFYQGDNFKGLKQPFTQVTKVITNLTDASSIFTKGDFVSVNVKNYTGYVWDRNYGDNPSMLNVVARIIYVNGANVYVDVCSDLRFNSEKVNGTIALLETVDNVTIENLVFEDINDTPIPTSITDNSERDSWVSGISVQYATSFTLNNYKASRHRFPALLLRGVYNPIVENFVASYPRALFGGCGYGMQVISSSHISIKNASGYGLRHLTDFTSSGHAWVENAKMVNDWYGAHDCHGMGEFDINYVNCTGNFLAGNGINEFPDVVGNISLVGCKGSLQMNFAQKIHVNNSLLYFDAMRIIRSPHVEIFNSKLVFKRTKFNFAAVPRGVYMQTAFIIDNVSIEITNENNPWQDWTNKLFEVDSYKNVRISNITYVRNLRNDVMMINLAKCRDITINDSVVENLGFNISNITSVDDNTVLANNSMAGGVLRILNDKFDESINATDTKTFFQVGNADDITSYLILLEGNMFNSSGKTRWLRLEVNTFNPNIIAENNLLRGRVGAKYDVGSKLPTFIKRSGNIDLSDTDEPSNLKSFDVGPVIVDIQPDWIEYTYKFTPDRIQPNDNYMIDPTPGWNAGSVWYEEKSTTGFKIRFSNPPTVTSKLTFTVIR